MSGHPVRALFVVLGLFPVTAFGQLPLTVEQPANPEARKLTDQISAQRSRLKLLPDPAGLNSGLSEIGKLVELARQARELELKQSGADGRTTKRLNLLVEGFERLQDRVDRIPSLIERNEHRLAAETLRFVAAMDRAWTGKYNPDDQPF